MIHKVYVHALAMIVGAALLGWAITGIPGLVMGLGAGLFALGFLLWLRDLLVEDGDGS